MKRIYLSIIFLLFLIPNAFAQEDEVKPQDLPKLNPIPPTYEEEVGQGRVQSAVNQFVRYHKYHFGFLRFRPHLSMHAGLSANSAFGNFEDENHKDEDFFIRVSPGISAGLKFGQRAYLRIIEDVNLVYFFKNEDRRDILPWTRGEFVTGTSDVLFTFQGGYLKTDEPLDEETSEVDEPVVHVNKYLGVNVEYSASSRIEMHHRFRVHSTTFEQPENTTLQLVDRRTYTLGTGAGYHWLTNVWLNADATFSISDAVQTDVTRNSWSVTFGPELRKIRFTAHARVGYGSGQSGEDSRRHNFLMDGESTFLLGKNFRLGFNANRRYNFSNLEDQTVIVTTQGGVRFGKPLWKWFDISGNYNLGEHDHGDQPVSGTTVTHDTFQNGRLSLGIHTIRYITIRPGIGYINRDTNIPDLDKERFGWFVSFGIGYSLDF
jgi:hypothetical protein